MITNSVEETMEVGRRLGRKSRPGDLLALCGELGSGKTVLVKGLAEGLGIDSKKYVTSPTFVLVKEYEGRLPLYHFDIYRLNDMASFSTLDYAEYFYGKGVTAIEWADKVLQALPDDYLRIDLTVKGENRRELDFRPRGERYKRLLERL